ncbi:MAG: tyrosine-type recombinase/integrase, partial [Rhizobiaceae bacterium]
MARKRALSAREVEALMNKPGTHRADENLFLQVRDDGTKSWVFRFSRGGRMRVLGLGPAAHVPYNEARATAADYRSKLWRGTDVAAEHRTRREQTMAVTEPPAAPSFKWCAEQVIAAREKFHKSEYAQRQWPSSMRDHVFPHIGKLAVDKVGLHEVHKVLGPIWQNQFPTAKKVRGRIARILDWAAAKGYRPDENPARPNGPLDQLLPPVRHRERHHASVPYVELPDVVARLKGMESISAKAVLFTILTGVRSSETRGAVWSEFDLDEKTWVIPPERNKTADEYRIPLADQTVALLKGLRGKGKLVFPSPTSGKQLSDTALTKVLKSIRPDETLHGFRATLSTWAREQTDYPAEVIEAALNHK